MIIVDGRHTYERHALNYIRNNTNIGQIRSPQELSRHVIYVPYVYPCLVEFYVSYCENDREYVAAIECRKKTAKSIVYPHTNVCNDGIWYKLSMYNEYDPIVKNMEARYRCDAIAHVDRYVIEEAEQKNESFLIGYALCHDNKLLKMFMVKKEEAKELVYYKQNVEKLRKENTETWNKHIIKRSAERILNNIERLAGRTCRREEEEIEL